MEKLVKLDDELEFLNSSNLEEVVEYVKEFSLRKKTEELLVNKFVDALWVYIPRHGLCQKAASMIVLLDNYELIELLLETKPKEYSVEALFFDIGNYETIVRWLEMHSSQYYPEIEIFWYEKNAKILKYIRENNVSSFGQYDLIRRGNDVAVKEMILRQRLNEKNRLNVATYSKKATVECLLEAMKYSKHYPIYRQIYNVRFVKSGVVSEMSINRLRKQAEDLFFEQGDIDEVLEYAEHFRLPKVENILLQRKKREGLINFLMSHKLSEEAEAILLKTADDWEVLMYNGFHELSPGGEETLIGRGSDMLIMHYISRHSFSDVGQKALIKRGNHKEIMAFVEKYPLTDYAEKLLWRRGVEAEIEAYFARKEASEQPL